MISVLEIASILFSSVAINHLGLVAAVEKVIARRLPVIDCPKCLTFWATLVYGLLNEWIATGTQPLGTCAVANFIPDVPSPTRCLSLFTIHFSLSLLCAWLAIWLDLLMGIIDQLYIKVYDTFYPTTNPTDTDALDTDNSLSVLPE